MSVNEIAGDARDIAETFDIATEDDDREYWMALQADEHFGSVCYNFKGVALYAEKGPHPTQHEQDAKEALERAIREHAQRVRGELDD